MSNLFNEMMEESSEKDKKISNLKAKLAESEKSKEKFKIMYFNQCKDYEHLQEYVNDRENSNEWLTQKDNENLENEVKQLKQQLAEKDEEIENVTIRHLDMLKYFIRHNSKQGIILSTDLEREIKEIEQGEKIWQTKNFNQDKISFCIEQLEHIKKRIYDLRYYENKCLNKKDCIEDCLEELDHQIEELKKEMK